MPETKNDGAADARSRGAGGTRKSARGRTDSSADRRLQDLAAARIAIEAVSPEIDGGRFPAKATAGGTLAVEADIFCDGHGIVGAAVLHRCAGRSAWSETPMAMFDNDRWRADVPVEVRKPHEFTVVAWRDVPASWRAETVRKVEAGQAVAAELAEARHLMEAALAPDRDLRPADRRGLQALLKAFDAAADDTVRLGLMLSDEAVALFRRAAPRTDMTQYDRILPVWVDRPAAAFSAWYELMPRSQSGDGGRHGTFDDVIARLPYIRDLGFDVLYMPPIHPIGRRNRKGRNNSLVAGPDDPGSPYAIGSPEGGHDAIHPELGDFDDFARLVAAADEHGLEIALDFAIQCAPDHPWIEEHPEWFEWRPDGTIKYAENPPKKYEDIVNVHFYEEAFPSLWYALRDVVTFWAERGVRIFRVDNPHTKPLPFWEWMIREVQSQYPDTIFLAEAFTRPKMMKRLAKVGFTQSYSYFTWRNTKAELTEYMTELTGGECRHYMR
ncbi:MAG: maltotransferase domain-containing protein, partial [Rhodospirillaceae bacterium]